MKRCSKCRVGKTLEEFTIARKSSDGRASACKQCHKQHRQAHKQEIHDRIRAWQAANPEKRRRYIAITNAKRPRRSGITQTKYQQQYTIQNECCAICKRHFNKLSADHCHTTGQKRGLLCRECNFVLGHFNDNSSLLRSAANYLQSIEGTTSSM